MYYFISSEMLACSYAKIKGKIGYVCMYVPSFCQAYTRLSGQPTTKPIIQEGVPERLWVKKVWSGLIARKQ